MDTESPSSSRTNYSTSALTDGWNDEAPLLFNAGNFLPTSNEGAHVTCSLCPTIFLLKNDNAAADVSPGGGTESWMLRSRMFKNLCNYMKISSNGIPSKCSRSSHPLCVDCEKHMQELWKIQGWHDRIGLKASKIVARIEKTVVDDTLISSGAEGAQQASFPRETYFKDKILEGYRNKLRLKHQGANANVIIEIKEEIHQGTFIAPEDSIRDPLDTSEFREESDDAEDREEVVNVDADDMDFLFDFKNEFEESISFPTAGGAGEEMEAETNEEVEQPMNLVIVGVEGCSGTAASNGASSFQRLKEEAIENQEEAYLVGEDDNDLLAVEPRKRRLLCDGVEIYKCSGPRPGNGKEYLQCGLCSHTLMIPKKKVRKGEATTFIQMKMHVQDVHNHKNVLGMRTRAKVYQRQDDSPSGSGHQNQYVCSFCQRSFSRKSTLSLHIKKTHKNQI